MTRVVGRTVENVASLPRWAQARIKQAEAEVEHLKSLLETIRPDSTNVTIVDYTNMNERGLPRDSHVRFRLGRVQVEVGLPYGLYKGDDLSLDVRSLDGRLIIEPQVSNVITVRVKR